MRCSAAVPSCSPTTPTPTCSASPEDELSAAVQHFVVRGGRVRGVRATTIDKELDISGADLVDQVLQRTYGAASPSEIPRQVLVPTLPDDAAELEQWLQERRGKRVSLQVAQRGRKADLLRTATINAQQALILHKTRRTSDYTARTKALTDLQLALGMDEAPLRIECYDVSHLSGPTSWHPWWSSKTACRARISTAPSAFAETTDDTDSLYQVLTRRLAHVDRDDAAAARGRRAPSPPPMPSRRWSPSASDRDSRTVRSCSSSTAARRRSPPPHAPSRTPATRDRPVRHRQATRGDLAAGEDFPVILPRTSEALYLLQRLRDEAHRFAITQHASQARHHDRAREVPGLGEARIKRSSSTSAPSRRSVERASHEITALPGIGPKLAAAIEQRLAKQAAGPRGSMTASTRWLKEIVGRTWLRTRRRRDAHRHRDVRRRAHDGGERARGSGVVRRRQPAAADAPAAARISDLAAGALPKIAAVVDVRGRDLFRELPAVTSALRAARQVRVLFLDASTTCSCVVSSPSGAPPAAGGRHDPRRNPARARAARGDPRARTSSSTRAH
jgi:hypothetical protein